MTNEYGLDYAYFKKKLLEIARDCENYTPREMRRALYRYAKVADDQEQLFEIRALQIHNAIIRERKNEN